MTEKLHPQLLLNLKKSVEFWIQTNNKYEDTAVEQIKRALTDILLDGLIFPPNPLLPSGPDNPANPYGQTENPLDKFIEDFEWLCRTAQIRSSYNYEDGRLLDTPPPQQQPPTTTTTLRSSRLGETAIASLPTPPSSASSTTMSTDHNINTTTTTTSLHTLEYFLYEWLTRNLHEHCLCACLQTLGTDSELLNTYYNELAYMRSENFTTALFICITAYELNQGNLLSKISHELYSTTISASADAATNQTKHKRTGSHPFSILLPTTTTTRSRRKESQVDQVDGSVGAQKGPMRNFPTLRKVKSLPIIEYDPKVNDETGATLIRPRSKTVNERWPRSQPKDIPNTTNLLKQSQRATCITPPMAPTSMEAQSLSGDDTPSTSSQHSHSPRIEIIKCDDIKIWTDQSYEKANELPKHGKRSSLSCDIPQSKRTQKPKSLSPMNSFLCSLFGTPPTYTSWSLSENAGADDSHMATDTSAVDVASFSSAKNSYPCNKPKDANNSSGVFDAFLPVCGQKLRKRKSTNLFDGDLNASSSSTALDYSPSTSACLQGDVASTPNLCKDTAQRPQTPKNNQSLTAYLQTAHLNRNDTELEKENAHFLISEAIISAIEHIKWAKMEPDKGGRRFREKATQATDWLEKDSKKQPNQIPANSQPSSHDSMEHITYAEVSENNLDLLSAEVVGLTLISKFDDKHVPKVSELKWLVSEDQAPQQLLPMPNAQPTENPDDNIIPSLTRGTKYWAPPRQQIIFTDHPQPNRQQLIQKQNNRCAGCGMRVARQYLRSFRYCTYLGKYFCTGCHRNQISAIPAKILQLWDFKCYPVSVFAYRLLEMMYSFPLFFVPDLNAALYVNNKILVTARNKRRHLNFVKDFIKTCRFAKREQKYFEMVPSYITDDPDLWSLADFVDTRNKSMHRSIDELIEKCSSHIYNCVLCSARGFICEHCHSTKVIYPWESKRFRCDRCGACFHSNCWKSMSETCCRCQRMNKRLDDITIADI